jgi:hypothetical protein
VQEELRALAALERECCAFADWLVRLRHSMVVMDIRGEGDVAIAAVQEYFVVTAVPRRGESVSF